MNDPDSWGSSDEQRLDGKAVTIGIQPDRGHHRGDAGEYRGDPYKLINFLLLVGTLVATCFAASYTGQSVQVGRDQERRSLRSYVIVSTKGISNFYKGGIATTLAILENLGQTPVYDGALLSGINVLPYPLAGVAFKYPNCRDILKTYPDTRMFFGKTSYQEKERVSPFNDVEVAQISRGQSAIYFTGRFCYKDVFNDVHDTDFCIEWLGKSGGLDSDMYCEFGNHSDH